MRAADGAACGIAPGDRQRRHTCLCMRSGGGHVGRRHRDRLRTADGPRNAPETTTPCACIRWLSCGRTDAHCSPSTCVTSASTPRTRRRTAATMRACVGACIGAMPLRQGVDDHLGIGVPIIRVLQRHGGRIIAASPGLWTLQLSLSRFMVHSVSKGRKPGDIWWTVHWPAVPRAFLESTGRRLWRSNSTSCPPLSRVASQRACGGTLHPMRLPLTRCPQVVQSG